MITNTEFEHEGQIIKATINHGDQYWPFKLAEIEETKNCIYVGEFALNNGAGWSESPYAVFYQLEPAEGHSDHFGLTVRGEYTYITSAQSAVDTEFIGMMSKDGEIVYSRFRHDYRLSTDGNVMVDGGRDYLKTNGRGRAVRLKIVNDEVKVLGFVKYDEDGNVI
jgi:hypothetical protein